MHQVIIELVLLFVSGFTLAENQIIKDFRNNNNTHRKPIFRKWVWWRSNNWHYDNRIVQWLMRYPLAWGKDGYHFTKGLAISLLAIVCIMGFSVIHPVVDFFIITVVIGTGFNTRFHL